MGYAVLSSRAVIPNLGYAFPHGYEPGNLEVREKNWTMAEKMHIIGLFIYNYDT